MESNELMGQVLGTTMQWATGTEALAALGALLALREAGAEGDAPAAVVDALRKVTAAAGLDRLDELPPQQAAVVRGVVRMYLHMALDLVEHPDRATGWTYTEPAILDGFGRGSAMIPSAIAKAHPDLETVDTFLDVGTGVGLLAVAAANVWPDATVVGIDPWGPSLERARTNVSRAGVDGRVSLRPDTVETLGDTDAFDCVWVPTFFLEHQTLVDALPNVLRALRPGGWVVLGVSRPSPDALTDALDSLKWLRSGGTRLPADIAAKLLADAGFADVHEAPPAGPLPIALVLGQRPTE
jgi:SAM-dependent methyltransferase